MHKSQNCYEYCLWYYEYALLVKIKKGPVPLVTGQNMIIKLVNQKGKIIINTYFLIIYIYNEV